MNYSTGKQRLILTMQHSRLLFCSALLAAFNIQSCSSEKYSDFLSLPGMAGGSHMNTYSHNTAYWQSNLGDRVTDYKFNDVTRDINDTPDTKEYDRESHVTSKQNFDCYSQYDVKHHHKDFKTKHHSRRSHASDQTFDNIIEHHQKHKHNKHHSKHHHSHHVKYDRHNHSSTKFEDAKPNHMEEDTHEQMTQQSSVVKLNEFLPEVKKVNDLAAMSLDTMPSFDESVRSKVIAQEGSYTYLPCRIYHLGDKTVSWIRNQDSHILTVGRITFISDKRFTARFDTVAQTWFLQIKFVTDQDAGSYECQVSSEPKISKLIQLEVVHPSVTIPGGSELHVRSGSDVTMKCVIVRAVHPPPHVFWYHAHVDTQRPKRRPIRSTRAPQGDRALVPKSIAIQTPMKKVEGSTAISELTIRGVTRARAGNYTCAPPGFPYASVTLHVLNEEHPAAMQHGTKSTTSKSSSTNGSSEAVKVELVYLLYLSVLQTLVLGIFQSS